MVELAPDQVRVQTQYTLMSTGTENIIFNRAFDEGSHWDQWVRYPFYPGYCAIGVVQEVGADVHVPSVGRRVALRAGHRSQNIVPSAQAYLVPESIEICRCYLVCSGKDRLYGSTCFALRTRGYPAYYWCWSDWSDVGAMGSSGRGWQDPGG